LQSTVLIAILNWGLGHATRSIPVIKLFLSKNYIVHIASDGEALLFLQKEFPQLEFHTLPTYGISYPYRSILLNVLSSGFSIYRAIYRERAMIESLVKKIKPDLIISDNRYGAWSKEVRSVIMTHQLKIILGNRLLSLFATGFIKGMVNKFDIVWIPDYNNSNSLGGELSKAYSKSKYIYIGPLSRFYPIKLEKKYDIAIVLSGPEPQRTKLEAIIIEKLKNIDKKVILVRGKVEDGEDYYMYDRVKVVNYMLSEDLNNLLNQSELIIARSGYSTIMDLAVLGKKAILIPTPGQTEQEYLAKHLTDKKIYYSVSQSEFDLEKALEKISEYSGVSIGGNDLKNIISTI